MKRNVVGFHTDAAGDWVADLSCRHGMHARHRPPFERRTWVLTEEGRRSRLGAEVDCAPCDRFELPSGLRVVGTAGPFTAAHMPPQFRHRHQLADGRWGVLRVLEGSVGLRVGTDEPTVQRLQAGDTHALPPGVPHAVDVTGPASFAIDLLAPVDAPR